MPFGAGGRGLAPLAAMSSFAVPRPRAWICGDVPASVLRRRMRTSTLSPWLCCTAVRGFALRGLFGLGRPLTWVALIPRLPCGQQRRSPGAATGSDVPASSPALEDADLDTGPLALLRGDARFCVKGPLWLGPTSDMDGAHSGAVLRAATLVVRAPGRLRRCSRVLYCAGGCGPRRFPLGFAARRCEVLR